jgi:mannose-6-phosphate isomerase-like protein (cupin superfamily)
MTRVVQKAWGCEEIFAETPHYTGKILHFDKGACASEHYHVRKDECWRVMSGIFEVTLSVEDTNYREVLDLGPGSTLRLPPLTVHRVRCIDGGSIMEVSTPDDPGDCVRLSLSIAAQ